MDDKTPHATGSTTQAGIPAVSDRNALTVGNNGPIVLHDHHLIETMQHYGVDSFPALLAATVQGSTETTFYVLAVYFGAVGIQRARHAVGCAVLADLAGVLASIGVCYWFFG